MVLVEVLPEYRYQVRVLGRYSIHLYLYANPSQRFGPAAMSLRVSLKREGQSIPGLSHLGHQFDLKIAYLTLRIDPPTPLQQAARSERQRFQRLLVDAKDARNGFKHVVSLDEATERDAPACAENKGGGRRESRVCVLCECKGWLLLC